MKKNFTRVVILLTAVVFLYASCTKNTIKPAATGTTNVAIDTKALSSQIATEFYASITGQHGGNDVSKGLNSPLSSKITNKNKLVVNSVNPLCGYVIDTTYKFKTGYSPFIDTVKTYFGNFNFTYTCDAGKVNGYIVKDSLANTESFGLNVNTFILAQKYAVKALDQTYKLVSMDGSLYVLSDLRNIEAPHYNITSSTYTLSGLRVNFSSGTADITSGEVTFKTVNTLFGGETRYQYQVTDLSGTLQFLGNHKAKLTLVSIYGTFVYNVDLLTGVVTQV